MASNSLLQRPRKRALLALACLLAGSNALVLTSTANADPTFYLPFPEGESYPITSAPYDHGGAADYNQHAVDFALPDNSTVLASAAGTVAFAGYLDDLSGNAVLVNHGDNRCTQYIHLNEVSVEKNQEVRSGQKIALSGSTGTVTGPHLHWNLVDCVTQKSLAVIDTVEMGTNYPLGESAKSQNVLDDGQQEQEVIPGEVIFKDEPGTDADTYTIPETEGVEYRIGDEVVDPGTYPGSGKVIVTARALDGYVLAEGATKEWSIAFDDEGPTSTPSATATSTPTASVTPTPTATATVTPTATATTTTSPPVIGLPSTGW